MFKSSVALYLAWEQGPSAPPGIHCSKVDQHQFCICTSCLEVMAQSKRSGQGRMECYLNMTQKKGEKIKDSINKFWGKLYLHEGKCMVDVFDFFFFFFEGR